MCKDIHYLYILKPVDDPALIRSVLSANSTYEKENEPENVLSIGDGEEGWYTEESAERFRRILAGEHYGVLCVDISIDEIRNTIWVYCQRIDEEAKKKGGLLENWQI